MRRKKNYPLGRSHPLHWVWINNQDRIIRAWWIFWLSPISQEEDLPLCFLLACSSSFPRTPPPGLPPSISVPFDAVASIIRHPSLRLSESGETWAAPEASLLSRMTAQCTVKQQVIDWPGPGGAFEWSSNEIHRRAVTVLYCRAEAISITIAQRLMPVWLFIQIGY